MQPVGARDVRYAIDELPGGDRIVRSIGLEKVGQWEICVRVAARRDDGWTHRVMDVLNFMARYILGTGARVLPEETMTYGWTHFQFFERAPALLETYEIEDVFSDEPKPGVVPGVDRAIRLAEAADDVMRRNALTGTSDFPYRGKGAAACRDLPDPSIRRLFLDRTAPHNPDDSGWSIGCGVDQDKHEPADLVIEHLAHLGARRPFIVPYLTLPTGCAVRFDDEGAIVFPSGSDVGRRDPGDPYSFGPDSVTV